MNSISTDMSVYAYLAFDSTDAKVKGTITADSPRNARDKLREQGLKVESIQDAVNSKQGHSVLFGNRFTSATKTGLLRELATLLSVGIPVLEALETLAAQHSGRLRNAILLVKDRIAMGNSLATAMANQPNMFDELTQRMVHVGESTGTLDRVLNQLADFKERSSQMKDQVLSALLYPMIVFTVSICVSIFLMTVVAPMLLNNLVEEGKPLPWPTQVLKSLSDLLVHRWQTIIAIGSAAIALFAICLSRNTGRRIWHHTLLRIPLLGKIEEKQVVARLALVISTMIRSGMDYITAVDFAANASKNLVFRKALQDSRLDVSAGVDIGTALSKSSVFTPLVVQIFSIGQETGQLDVMLERLSIDYERQVSSFSRRFAAILEPILILILSILVGFILLATLLPILEASNVL